MPNMNRSIFLQSEGQSDVKHETHDVKVLGYLYSSVMNHIGWLVGCLYSFSLTFVWRYERRTERNETKRMLSFSFSFLFIFSFSWSL